MGPQFYQTMMGRKFFESDVPRMIAILQKMTLEMERMNQNMEKLIESKIEIEEEPERA